jgi:hypothetical protein
MNPIIAKEFLDAWTSLWSELDKAEAKPGQLANESERGNLRTALCKFDYQCRQLQLLRSRELCEKLLDQTGDQAWHHDAAVRQASVQGLPRPRMSKEVPLPGFDAVYAQLRTLIELAWGEMDNIRFALIFGDNASFFEQTEIFGKDVKDSASPKLNAEIKAAGNCLAADLHTAAVFHLMRISEHGLLALAKHLKVPWSKSFLIEFSEWEAVLKAIDDVLETLRQTAAKLPRGSAKDEELEFYSGLRNSLNYFKVTYRNPVSHLRGDFDKLKALIVFEEVKKFMQKLATKVPLN